MEDNINIPLNLSMKKEEKETIDTGEDSFDMSLVKPKINPKIQPSVLNDVNTTLSYLLKPKKVYSWLNEHTSSDSLTTQDGDTTDTAKIFSCDACNYTTLQKRCLKSHQTIHIGFQCNKCSFKTPTKKAFIRHKLVHVNEMPLCCKKCQFRCDKIETLTLHETKHFDGNPNDIIFDQLIQRDDMPLKCDQCNYRCSISKQMIAHNLKHNAQKSYSFDLGGLEVVQEKNFIEDQVIHKQGHQFVCHQCDYKCSEKEDFLSHKLEHGDKKIITCNTCDFKTFTKFQLRQHKYIHSNEETFGCDQCLFKTNRKDILKNHKFTHTDKRRFHCDICDYKTNEKKLFITHRLNASHSPIPKPLVHHFKPQQKLKHGKEKISCDKCDFKTVNLNTLKNHLKTHKDTSQNPLPMPVVHHFLVQQKWKPAKEKLSCDKCDFQTVNLDTLKKHLKIHIPIHNLKPAKEKLSCDKCDFKTINLCTFKKHQRSHKDTSLKPVTQNVKKHKLKPAKGKLSCDKCDFQTFYYDTLIKHQNGHIDETVCNFNCDRCPYSCRRESLLKKHKLLHRY